MSMKVIVAIGFAATVAAVLYVGQELKQQLIIVAKQVDSQPYRIAQEANLLPSKVLESRPALDELPPEVIRRLIPSPK
ncbi:hypothetical protein [Pseudomonas veronii]